MDVTTRVTRRSETTAPPDRLDTSEYFQQVVLQPCSGPSLLHSMRVSCSEVKFKCGSKQHEGVYSKAAVKMLVFPKKVREKRAMQASLN